MIPAYINALIKEITAFLPRKEQVVSLYFGGGTPSIVPTEFHEEILGTLTAGYRFAPKVELTLEANPGAVRRGDLKRLHNVGFNRLSIGLQAVQDHLLHVIGRIHSFKDFSSLYEEARQTGFLNINVDLICGLPGQTMEMWQESLMMVCTRFGPEHVSVYSLQLEHGTPLAARVSEGILTVPDEEETVVMLEWAYSYLATSGYEHYEVSNFAKPGFQSVHNLGYWTGRDYLGFGAGAASTLDGKRWVNCLEPEEYLCKIQQKQETAVEKEILEPRTVLTEAIILGLRLRSGIDLPEFKQKHGMDLYSAADSTINFFIGEELLELIGERLRLTDRGILVSNQILARILADLTHETVSADL